MSLELLEVQLLQKLKVRMMSRKEKKSYAYFYDFTYPDACFVH